MRKWYVLLIVAVSLFIFCACDTVTETVDSLPTTGTVHPTDEIKEETFLQVPSLESTEYWEIVKDEIIAMLNSHDLYVSRIDSAYPCIQFFVEPGNRSDDGKVVAVGLSQEQYEELYQSIKEELHIILDKYELAKPKTAFHACDSIVGVFFYNWFADGPMLAGNVTSLQVASYQLDLLEYYHDYEEDSYLRMEGFSEDMWSKYVFYASEE